MPMPRPLPASKGSARAQLPVLGCSLLSALTLLTGCTTGTGEPKSAGRMRALSAPQQLWPDRKPAPRPTYAKRLPDGVALPVRGLPQVPSGDIHQVPVPAIAKAHANDSLSEGEDAQKIKHCQAAGREPCPIRTPHFRDLNGDGRDELVLGIDMGSNSLFLWVFTVKDNRVTLIMDESVHARSVKLSGRELIVQEPEGNGYDTRMVFAWNARLQAMQERGYSYVKPSPGQ
ncbi:hypothetical protein ACFY12_10465 [Streptomyces sp. NPDC001339]|uniref:hypothetical protein n=1 Tax=Streptomyces sp. NPDC001339 TaxID=3364563 RepID=UPI00367DAF28